MGELQKLIAFNYGLWFVSVEKQHGDSCKVADLKSFFFDAVLF